jgi:Xaa-Pro dipeptidase
MRPKPIGYDKKKASRLMETRNVDVLIATTPRSVFYTSGLPVGHAENNPIMFSLSNQNPTIVVIYRNGEESLVKWNIYNPSLSWIEEVEGIGSPAQASSAVVSFIKKAGVEKGTIGIESLTPYYLYEKLKQSFPNAAFKVADNIFLEMTMIKSEEEIKRIKESTKIAEKAIRTMIGAVAEGVSDLDFIKIAKSTVIQEGAAGFDHVTLSIGQSDPEAPGTGVKMKRGDLTRFDIGAIYHGYCSDVSRHAILGNVPSDAQEAFDATLCMQQALVDAMKSGVSVAEVNKAAQETYESTGREATVFATVHSLGLQCEEFIFLGPLKGPADRNFEANMVLDIEVWTMHPECGLLGNEDTYLVTQNGCKRMSTLDRKIFPVIK